MSFVIVDGALPGPLAVNFTVYFPGAENICIGSGNVEELLGPDVGSPKSHSREGHSVEVFLKVAVLAPVQV